jgi:hypothetical protein
MKAFRLLALALLLWGASALADEVEVIQLQYRTAEQMIPTLRPLVAPGGALTGMQSSLVIRSNRANIEDIKRVIASLDRAPRRLLISVRQDSGAMSSDRTIAGGATVSGDRGRVSIGQSAPTGSGASVRITDSTRAEDDRLAQQVQALEGSPALISVGESIPVPTRSVTRGPGGAIVSDTVVYRDTGSGFYVVPRVAGDRVTLEIDPQRETPGRHGPGSVNTQRVATTATGRLGEWVELGGVDQSATRDERGFLSRGRTSRQSGSRVWVKVDEIK